MKKVFCDNYELETTVKEFYKAIRSMNIRYDVDLWSNRRQDIIVGVFEKGNTKHYNISQGTLSGWAVHYDIFETVFGIRKTVITLYGISVRTFRKILKSLKRAKYKRKSKSPRRSSYSKKPRRYSASKNVAKVESAIVETTESPEETTNKTEVVVS